MKNSNKNNMPLELLNVVPASTEPKKLAKQLGDDLVGFHLSDVQQAFYETSPVPTGNWRKYWTMKLFRKPSRSRLPRGFSMKQFKQFYV